MTPENGLIQLLEQRKIPLDRLSMEGINISMLSIESTNKFYFHFIFYVSILNRSSVRIKLSIQLAEHKKIETAIQSPRNFNTKIFELLGKVEMRSIHLEPNLFFIFSPKKNWKLDLNSNRYSSYQRNEPSSLAVTLEIVSAYLQMKPEDVSLKTTFNALKFFGISC